MLSSAVYLVIEINLLAAAKMLTCYLGFTVVART